MPLQISTNNKKPPKFLTLSDAAKLIKNPKTTNFAAKEALAKHLREQSQKWV